VTLATPELSWGAGQSQKKTCRRRDRKCKKGGTENKKEIRSRDEFFERAQRKGSHREVLRERGENRKKLKGGGPNPAPKKNILKRME